MFKVALKGGFRVGWVDASIQKQGHQMYYCNALAF